jgi:GNAT superfamily N-acetyltransferase
MRRRLSLQGARLLPARRDSPRGFILFTPRARTLKAFYLAIDPNAWGCGAASQLLLPAKDWARELRRKTLEPLAHAEPAGAAGARARSAHPGRGLRAQCH